MGTIPGRGLAGDAAPAAGDDAHHATKSSPVGPKLLVVTVTSDQQVQPQAGVQGTVPPGIVAAGEVSHHDLPVCFGIRQLGFNPRLLLGIETPEPVLAGVH
eukprot:Skav227546  [mRNA]  locus=scaffold2241:315017:323115:+ [translate_table: standard]